MVVTVSAKLNNGKRHCKQINPSLRAVAKQSPVKFVKDCFGKSLAMTNEKSNVGWGFYPNSALNSNNRKCGGLC